MGFAALALLGGMLLLDVQPDRAAHEERLGAVVIDPGHGGDDVGAVGRGRVREKDVVLQVARRLGDELEEAGIRVVYTRTRDRFLTLAERTDIANRARGDLYLSIHANFAKDPDANGPETYFLSLEASDDDALRVALAENRVFGLEGSVADSDDIVGNILGDLILEHHQRGSSRIAAAVQRNLARLPGPDRGVKQAPFVVLMGVNMPAALVEIGFLSNPDEAQKLSSSAYQDRIAAALARAVHAYRDARYGEAREEAAE